MARPYTSIVPRIIGGHHTMTDRSPMHQQIDTLPTLIRDIVKPFDASARRAFDFETCTPPSSASIWSAAATAIMRRWALNWPFIS